jgi:hypothetical protein
MACIKSLCPKNMSFQYIKNLVSPICRVFLHHFLFFLHVTYADALKLTGLETLSARRAKLCLSFAKKCTKSDKTSFMFPEKETIVKTRHHEKFVVAAARTDRYAKSAIPYMQRLLNANA